MPSDANMYEKWTGKTYRLKNTLGHLASGKAVILMSSPPYQLCYLDVEGHMPVCKDITDSKYGTSMIVARRPHWQESALPLGEWRREQACHGEMKREGER